MPVYMRALPLMALGYQVLRPETVDMGEGVWLARFAMEKML